MRAWGAFAASAALHALLLGLGVLVLVSGDREAAPPTLRLVVRSSLETAPEPPAPGDDILEVRPRRPESPSTDPPLPDPAPPVSGSSDAQETSGPSEPVFDPQTVPGPPGPLDGPMPDRPARLVSEVQPVYPREARSRGWEGGVVLGVSVGTDGSVTGVEVRSSSGRAVLDRAATAAALGARFLPAMSQGAPQPATVVVTVRFRLQ